MPLLKYQTYIDTINSEREAYDNIGICPCEDAISKEILAFRFVFENMDNLDNFIPQSIKAIQQDKKPRRFPKTPVFLCDGFGLSMYISKESAKTAWGHLPIQARNNLAYKQIAKGLIEKNDGVITPIQTNGHFDLHEFQHTDLAKKFTIIDTL